MNGLSAAEAEKEADALRATLGATLERLKDNLRPSQLAREAMVSTRAHAPDWLMRFWHLAQSPVGLTVIGAATGSLAGLIVARHRRSARGAGALGDGIRRRLSR